MCTWQSPSIAVATLGPNAVIIPGNSFILLDNVIKPMCTDMSSVPCSAWPYSLAQRVTVKAPLVKLDPVITIVGPRQIGTCRFAIPYINKIFNIKVPIAHRSNHHTHSIWFNSTHPLTTTVALFFFFLQYLILLFIIFFLLFLIFFQLWQRSRAGSDQLNRIRWTGVGQRNL